MCECVVWREVTGCWIVEWIGGEEVGNRYVGKVMVDGVFGFVRAFCLEAGF